MLEEFFHYLRFPSVSAAGAEEAGLRACAGWLQSWLAEAGMRARLVEAGGPPVVLARSPHLPERPTLLLYGHYDVQPAREADGWSNPPFQPVERNGYVVARGATDNKGPTFALLLGLRDLLRAGRLSANVVVVLEGEEEVGSPHFGEFLRQMGHEVACDVAVVADTSMAGPGQPTLTNALRGICCYDVVVRGPKCDLHSGMFGGAIQNPALVLSRILADMVEADGRVAIPGFYDGVIPPEESEKAGWRSLPYTPEWFARAAGVEPRGGERGLSLLERVWARPTAEINGLSSGYSGAGSKTIIPAQASTKMSFRLVPGQTSARVRRVFEEWFARQLHYWQVEGEARHDHSGEPFYVSPDEPRLRLAGRALARVFGREPVLVREGLSIPAAVSIQQELHVPVVLTGLGLPDCRAHGPDETFPVAHLAIGRELFPVLLEELFPGGPDRAG